MVSPNVVWLVVLLLLGCLKNYAEGVGDYLGSQAYNHSKLFSASVNTATGTFNFSYPLIKAPGVLAPFHLNLSYRFNAKGMFGFPTGWCLDLDYISDKTAMLSGKQWLIDPLWHDETRFGSGLKYYNQHGSHFEALVAEKEIPSHKGLFYRYKATYKDGSIKYFSHQGLLILDIDRFNNTVLVEYQKPIESLGSARVVSITDNYNNTYRFSYEPNVMVIHYPDSRVQHIYFNGEGVIEIVDPAKQNYTLSYVQKNGRNLIRRIESPEGLSTQLTYDTIPYHNGASKKEMPIVTQFKQVDVATSNTHHEAHYTFSKENNYTGYPFYHLSSDGDSLMDSNNQNFHYSVDVKRSSGDKEKPLMHTQVYVYNYLHLPIEIRTLDQGKNYTSTVYDYAISPFKYSRSTNYDKPTTVTNKVWDAETSAYMLSDQTTHTYDNHGNKLTEHQYVYDRDKKAWKKTTSTLKQYFLNNYSLPCEKLHVDALTGMQIRTTYFLAKTGKTHASKTISYQLNSHDKIWHPWQKEILGHDKQGRKISHSLEWAEKNKTGVQKTSSQKIFHFNKENALLNIENHSALGHVKTEVIDTRNGNKIKTITPMGEDTEYTYDALGRQIQHKDPEGNISLAEYAVYQADGMNAATHKTPLGYEKRTIFDASHRAVEHQDYHQNDWRLQNKKSYNGWGKVTERTNSLGLSTVNEYDEQERLSRSIDPSGNKTILTYDDNKRITARYFNGHKISEKFHIPWMFTTYDRTFPVFENTNDPQDSYIEKSTIHNGFGQAIKKTSSLVNQKTGKHDERRVNYYSYDISHNLIKNILEGYDGIHYERHTQHDLFNNKVSHKKTVQTERGVTTHQGYLYRYDEDNRLVEVSPPEVDGQLIARIQYHYDKNGRQTQKVLQNGHTVHYQYNTLGHLTSKNWYRDDKLYTLNYSYDTDGHLVRIADSDDKTIDYEYTPNGHLLSLHYPDGRSLSYHYDAYDRMTSQVDFNHLAQQFIYHEKDKGELSEVHYGDNKFIYLYGVDDNGSKGQLLALHTNLVKEGETHTTYRYGAYGLLASSKMKNKKIIFSYDVHYRHKPRGVLYSQTTCMSEGQNQQENHISYTYDSLNRLLSESHSNTADQKDKHVKTVSYRYDGNNNLTEEIMEADKHKVTCKRQYNALDQLVALDNNGQSNSVDIIHDTNGRLLQDSFGVRYEYDGLDHLLRVTGSDGKITNYQYLPNGLLGSKFTSGKRAHSHFYYDEYKNVVTAYKDYHWTTFIRNGSNLVAAVEEQGIAQLHKSNESTGVVVKEDKPLLSTGRFQHTCRLKFTFMPPDLLPYHF